MDFDFNNVADVLNNSGDFLQEVADQPADLMTKFPQIFEKFQVLQAVVDIDKIKRGVPDMDAKQKEIVYKAIDNFLDRKKEIEEKAGAIAATIFSNPQFVTYTNKLKDLSKFLKRGDKVEPTEHDPL